MTRALIVVALALQLADALTFALAPAYETNSFATLLYTHGGLTAVLVAKVVLIAATVWAIRLRRPAWGSDRLLHLSLGIIATFGAVGLAGNLFTLAQIFALQTT